MRACEICGTSLLESRSRFCSYECKGKGTRKPIDEALFKRLALEGARVDVIAPALGVTTISVRRFMRRDGIYSQWSHARYKKYTAAA